MPRVITLTTDFGLSDWFVGAMKGVILDIHPEASIVDLTHGIPAGDIHAGAFALAAGYQYFPNGTIHIVVVDPGVGSDRKALAVQTERYSFVGPDNGVLSLVLRNERIISLRELTNDQFFRKPVSSTFHGRDIFAPVGAYLGKGIAPENFGPELKSYQRLSSLPPSSIGDQVRGSVVYIDRYGNAITNIQQSPESGGGSDTLEVILSSSAAPIPVGSFYQEANEGEAIALISSSGFLEIAINQGNAAAKLNLKAGTEVFIRKRPGNGN